MKYKVLLPFSHRFNGVFREEPIGKEILDKEIDPSILNFMLSKGKLKPIGIIKKKDNKKEISVKKKVTRVSKEEYKKEDVEQNLPLMGAYELSEEGLKNKSKSELKRISTQLGLASSGTKEVLKTRLIKSGL